MFQESSHQERSSKLKLQLAFTTALKNATSSIELFFEICWITALHPFPDSTAGSTDTFTANASRVLAFVERNARKDPAEERQSFYVADILGVTKKVRTLSDPWALPVNADQFMLHMFCSTQRKPRTKSPEPISRS